MVVNAATLRCESDLNLYNKLLEDITVKRVNEQLARLEESGSERSRSRFCKQVRLKGAMRRPGRCTSFGTMQTARLGGVLSDTVVWWTSHASRIGLRPCTAQRPGSWWSMSARIALCPPALPP